MILAIWCAMQLGAVELPVGSAPEPVTFDHFPTRLHACVWRNWTLVPMDTLANVCGAETAELLDMGRAMGLEGPPEITPNQQRRSYITVIRRNWHLLPYEQLLSLLGWTAEEMAYTLREDDFLYIKLGSLKPKCEPVRYEERTPAVREAEARLAGWVKEAFPDGAGVPRDPLFAFVARLSEMPAKRTEASRESQFNPRYAPSYFALYGDPLLEDDPDQGSFPSGYLARLAASGVNGVWMQAVLYKLTPFPWDPSLSEHYEKRLENLKALVARARGLGIGIYLYLNEPRAMPLSFYDEHPDLKGTVEGDHAALCTSAPEVREYIRDAVERIAREVPDLAGFFTISASENLTNCWSHSRGQGCVRCGTRAPDEVIAEFHSAIYEGIQRSGASTRLFAWDWGWQDAWVENIVQKLPAEVALQSVSEWSIPVTRGGVDSVVGEYSISTVGPGPRATRHWGFAKARGLQTLAKIQTNNTWELSPVPYVPAVANVAQHAANLRESGVDGLMLSWTLGGCPSPNLEVVAELGADRELPVDDALLKVARNRVGETLAPVLVEAWKAFSASFSEYPYHIGVVYNAPVQMGPANLLFARPTGYHSTMVGLPYDDVDRWRAVFPADVFAQQYELMAQGFQQAIGTVRTALENAQVSLEQRAALDEEMRIAEACAIHFQSVAGQTRFVMNRNQFNEAPTAESAQAQVAALHALLDGEIALAQRMHALQSQDSRFGFEASNHYFYVPADLVEKVINCRFLKETWLNEQQ
ncbi:MAG: hypothetical protein ACOX5J_09465 [Candidatus Hydrogenedentales bacterium]